MYEDGKMKKHSPVADCAFHFAEFSDCKKQMTLSNFMRIEAHSTCLQLVYEQLHCLLQEDPVFVVKTVLNRTVDIKHSV